MRQVTIKYVWRCGLCVGEIETLSTAIPIGWYQLDGYQRIPIVACQESPALPRPEKIICSKCAHILERALEFTKTPYHIVKAQTGWDKPISPGMITLMG